MSINNQNTFDCLEVKDIISIFSFSKNEEVILELLEFEKKHKRLESSLWNNTRKIVDLIFDTKFILNDEYADICAIVKIIANGKSDDIQQQI